MGCFNSKTAKVQENAPAPKAEENAPAPKAEENAPAPKAEENAPAETAAKPQTLSDYPLLFASVEKLWNKLDAGAIEVKGGEVVGQGDGKVTVKEAMNLWKGVGKKGSMQLMFAGVLDKKANKVEDDDIFTKTQFQDFWFKQLTSEETVQEVDSWKTKDSEKFGMILDSDGKIIKLPFTAELKLVEDIEGTPMEDESDPEFWENQGILNGAAMNVGGD